MSEHAIDSIIAKARDEALSRQREKQAEMEHRRSEALRRIGQAVADHNLSLEGEGGVAEQLELRLMDAQRVRISEAEAMADLAQWCGDLSSKLDWWEIRTREGTVLWKDYVLPHRAARVRRIVSFDGRTIIENPNNVREEPVRLDINVRRGCQGAYVACMYVGYDSNRAVGISEGPQASVVDAVANVYLAYFEGEKGFSLEREDIPGAILDGLIDSEMEEGVESTNSRSLESAVISRRESEEQGE